MAGRCLIVANQTLGGADLERAVRDYVERDVRLFYVVVPMTPVEHEEATWKGGFVLGEFGADMSASAQGRAAMEEDARRREAELDEARRRAQWRLDLMLEKLRDLGADAEGAVGSSDPVQAARDALEYQAPFDEVIVSTLPAGVSRWLKMDLPNRISRMTDAPVSTIEAEAE